ncbi:hypothetical protein ASE16_05065 [Leifsonia sp. Root227]|uniref:hypothetical protein n=1 Tax=unclassified Leifsonia TaxID=2663824 RepID=UPI0007004B6B|nr:hypothetical protein [Leifsonia sp. Root227]KRC50409.1 hypothetical protein ASE16_05065 [Leifsonia sp. Root227]
MEGRVGSRNGVANAKARALYDAVASALQSPMHADPDTVSVEHDAARFLVRFSDLPLAAFRARVPLSTPPAQAKSAVANAARKAHANILQWRELGYLNEVGARVAALRDAGAYAGRLFEAYGQGRLDEAELVARLREIPPVPLDGIPIGQNSSGQGGGGPMDVAATALRRRLISAALYQHIVDELSDAGHQG